MKSDKAVIFDLDGTLLDTVHDIRDNVNNALKKCGYKERNLEEISAFIGSGARNLIASSLGCEDEVVIDECLKFYNQIYTSSGSPKTRLFEGVDELLIKLKDKGFKLAILTNKPHETTEKVYEKYLKQFNFDFYLGSGREFKRKPDKASTLYILEKLSVLPENTFFVGDGETDVLTSINAGTKGISVLWGYRKKEQLQAVGAKIFAENTLQLLHLITDWFIILYRTL